jgi:uncharacterized protein YdhG (YjbR/CyaY superfamily)
MRDKKQGAPTDIASYIESRPPNVRKVLQKIRATIRKAAPAAREAFKYRIPTYEQNGHLIFFAAAKGHVGIYPRTKGIDALPEVAAYASGKGTVRFAFDAPIPYPLIAEMVKVRVAENTAQPGRGAKASAKAKAKAAKKGSTKKRSAARA